MDALVATLFNTPSTPRQPTGKIAAGKRGLYHRANLLGKIDPFGVA